MSWWRPPLRSSWWPSSTSLLTRKGGGLELLSFGLVIQKRFESFPSFFNFFPFPGMNSILLYLGHSTAWQMPPFNWAYGPMRTHFVRFPESLWGVSLWMLVSYVLYKKKAFVVVWWVQQISSSLAKTSENAQCEFHVIISIFLDKLLKSTWTDHCCFVNNWLSLKA